MWREKPDWRPIFRGCPQGLIQRWPKLDRFKSQKIATVNRKQMNIDSPVKNRICF